MADNNDLLAKSVFDTLCAALDHDSWNYKKDAENLRIESGARGEDLPIELNISIQPKSGAVLLLSSIPVTTPEDKRIEMAVAVAVANNGMRWGNFDYHVADGRIFFRMAGSYLGNLLGEEFFKNMLYTGCSTIDRYNDRFLMLAKGLLTLEKFVELDQQ